VIVSTVVAGPPEVDLPVNEEVDKPEVVAAVDCLCACAAWRRNYGIEGRNEDSSRDKLDIDRALQTKATGRAVSAFVRDTCLTVRGTF
jgi:hypothetical protein